VHGEALVLAPRLGGPAEVEVDVGERGAPGGHRGQRVGELAHGLLELVEAPLRAPQPEELGAGEDRHRGVLQAPAELDALVDEPLGILGAALHEHPARAVQRDVRARARIAHVGGDAVERFDRHVGAGEVVHLEQQVDRPRARAHRQLGIADLLGQREELLRPLQAALGRVRPTRGERAEIEDVGERGAVAEAARDRERLLDELLTALHAVGEVERRGEAHEHARAQRAVLGRERRERLLERRDEEVVDDPGGEAEAAEAERRAGHQLHRAELARERDRLGQRRDRALVGRVHERLPAGEHELAAAALVGLLLEFERA
jgi:hypothetical protein